MMPLQNLADQKFGRLTVLPLVKMNPTMWLCKCDCGRTLYIRSSTMKSGDSKSCGCLRKELARSARKTHGKSGSPEWRSWCSMKSRCTTFSKDASRYAARGITVCKRWNSFENFFNDMGPRPKNTSIERLDNNKGYSPENCVWADRKIQGRNTSANKFITFNGVTKTQSAWAEDLGVCDTVIMRRIKASWPLEIALTKPARKSNKNRVASLI